eukprot:Tbor_TRINITY_DN5529_c1_g1::TRINITY_DN5529_c1_g1_i10::g.12949::m.12949
MISFSIPFVLIFLYWYGALSFIFLGNYIFWLRFQPDEIFPPNFKNSYITFAIIGFITYAFISGPLLVMSFKYSPTAKSKLMKSRIAVALMFTFSTSPIFAILLIHSLLPFQCRICHPINGIVFLLSAIGWWFGLFHVWFAYMSVASDYLHRKSNFQREVMFTGVSMDEIGKVPPPMSLARPVAGQPEIV